MVLFLIRTSFLIMVMALTLSFAYQDDIAEKGKNYITFYIIIPAAIALILVIGDILWKRKQLHVLSGLFFGLLAGLFIAYLITLVIGMVVAVFPGLQEYSGALELAKVLFGAFSVFVCVSFVMQTKDDFRFVIPYVEFAKQTKGARPLLLDTSVIIDGRITDITATGVLDTQLIVPRFILEELQSVADSSDRLKRNRGRRGLDVLHKLRENKELDLSILDIRVPKVDRLQEVDAKLVSLAKHLDGRILTTDYNLNKVARLRNIEVININDLANALKPVVLPGEKMQVRIIKPGEEANQGVGYLDDGTMVVVEQARNLVGQEVTSIVTSVLQTSAGRMIFTKVDPENTPHNGNQRS